MWLFAPETLWSQHHCPVREPCSAVWRCLGSPGTGSPIVLPSLLVMQHPSEALLLHPSPRHLCTWCQAPSFCDRVQTKMDLSQSPVLTVHTAEGPRSTDLVPSPPLLRTPMFQEELGANTVNLSPHQLYRPKARDALCVHPCPPRTPLPPGVPKLAQGTLQLTHLSKGLASTPGRTPARCALSSGR